MAHYKAKCGRYFTKSDCGECYYMGEQWGKIYGKETTYCFEELCRNCEYHKAFRELYPSRLIGDCDGVLVDDLDFDYTNSLDKIRDDYSKQSYDLIAKKFGGLCPAISPDGKGGLNVRRDEITCANCWNEICVVTKKKRNVAKCKIIAIVETRWMDEVGFYSKEHKVMTHKEVTGLIPMDFAERLIKECDNLVFKRFEMNNCEMLSIELGFAPKPTILQYYIKKSNAKRDLLADLKAVEDGYEVIHESDLIKERQKAKTERRKLKQQVQERKRKRKHLIVKQISIFEEGM